ncbi:MAG: ribonuclease P protein component, partial [Spirochaetes bacterium]|nr:ribonuclease P protein component [Spirochaetota bacterium]
MRTNLLFSFDKKERLKKRNDFSNVFDHGKLIKAKFYNCRYFKNLTDTNRIGIIVRKNIGNAVVRNHEKRLVREFFRKNKHVLKNKLDLVFICKQPGGSFLNKKREFEQILIHTQEDDRQ